MLGTGQALESLRWVWIWWRFWWPWLSLPTLSLRDRWHKRLWKTTRAALLSALPASVRNLWQNKRTQLLEREKRNLIHDPEGEKGNYPFGVSSLNPAVTTAGRLPSLAPGRPVACFGELPTEEAFLNHIPAPVLYLLGPRGGKDFMILWPPTGSLISCVNLSKLLSDLCVSLPLTLGVKMVPASQPCDD